MKNSTEFLILGPNSAIKFIQYQEQAILSLAKSNESRLLGYYYRFDL